MVRGGGRTGEEEEEVKKKRERRVRDERNESEVKYTEEVMECEE
jgi:hypothetical protein